MVRGNPEISHFRKPLLSLSWKINGGSKITRAQVPGSLSRSLFHGTPVRQDRCHGKYIAQPEVATRKRSAKRNKYPGIFISPSLQSPGGLPTGHTEPEAS